MSKLNTYKHFFNMNYKEAKEKYSDIKTWPSAFLLILLSQAATTLGEVPDIQYWEIVNEVDRRFNKAQRAI